MFQHLIRAFATTLILGAGTSLQAQTPTDHSAMGQGKMAAGQASPAADKAMAQGEIKKIDLKAKTITLKHGPIKSVDMPPMTMAFKVGSDALLTRAKVGDKVNFIAELRSDVLFVTAIEPSR